MKLVLFFFFPATARLVPAPGTWCMTGAALVLSPALTPASGRRLGAGDALPGLSLWHWLLGGAAREGPE